MSHAVDFGFYTKIAKDAKGTVLMRHLDNRPFLRCLFGFGLTLWRVGRFAEAAQTFERLLQLNPPDHQQAHLLLDEIRQKTPWKPN